MRNVRAVALLSALLLAVLALVVWLGATRDADVAGIRAAQSIASRELDLIANGHTAIGQVIPTVLAALVLAAIAWWRGRGAVRVDRDQDAWRRLAWAAPLLILVTGAIELALKQTTGHAPPGDEYIRAFMNPLGVRVHTPSAFPSGHVTRLTFLALMAVAMFPSTWLRAAGVVLVAVSLFLRVYIGDHWPSDVIGGLLLGVAVGGVAILWYQSAASKSSFARRK
ncbi:MAG: phosphatase PAP2 family protein [Chloroflexota bacterium]|nr:phosphatase PAP2 family protein [Chloroflexota bacterium]